MEVRADFFKIFDLEPRAMTVSEWTTPSGSSESLMAPEHGDVVGLSDGVARMINDVLRRRREQSRRCFFRRRW